MSGASAQPSAVKAPQIHLGAFGKHPGWNDHMDDLGLETPALIALKRKLYIEGVGGNIDGGKWERLDAHQRLEGFNHVFIGSSGDGFLAGRLWASRDGKGRAHYPMVLAAHCAGLSLLQVLQLVLPRLEELRSECLRAATADQVRALVAGATSSLRAAAAPELPLPDWFSSGRDLISFAGTVGLESERCGFHRVFYQLRRDMRAYLREAPARGAGAAAQHIRLPAVDRDSQHPFVFWWAILRALLQPATPIMLFRPVEWAWLDAVIGEGAPAQLYCLLASEMALPLASEIPYSLTPANKQESRQWIEAAGANEADLAALVAAPGPADAAPGWQNGLRRGLGRLKSMLGSNA